MKNQPQIEQKKDHTVVVTNFFGEGENLEVHQLGWQLDDKLEAKSSVSKKYLTITSTTWV